MSLVPYVHLDVDLSSCRPGDELELSRDERHHLFTVLRLRPGAPLEIADGSGWSAPGELTEHGVRVVAGPDGHEPGRPMVTVAQALTKGRKLDEVVRQLTELGIDRLVPVDAGRSESKPAGAKADQAVARWRSVGRAAAEQARRPWLPEVTPIHRVADLTTRGWPSDDVLLVAVPGARPLPDELGTVRAATAVTIAIGPEGGWASEELEAFQGAGALPIGLGPTILRTEHAAAAAVAVLAAGVGRWA